MNKLFKRLTLGAVSALTVVGLSGGSAVLAQSNNTTYQANLNALNGSGDSGTATVTVDGDQVTVKVNTTDVSPGLPHAQHFHIGGTNTCPTADADEDDDDIINTAEGQPAYGEVKVSLTTEGDTSADSALAVDRFPVAENGTINYERTFTLPEGVTADDVSNAVVVQHGLSELFEDKAKYDGEKKSSLKEDLPLEATVPALCGALTAMPTGGADTGAGSTAATDRPELIALGAISLVAAGGALAIRQTAKQS